LVQTILFEDEIKVLITLSKKTINSFHYEIL